MSEALRVPRIRPLGSFGIDAPWVPIVWTFFGVLFLAFGANNLFAIPMSGWWFVSLAYFFGGALVWLAGAAFYLNSSLRGKFVVWAGLLDGLRLTGAEKILDLGCGRGAISILAAERTPTGSIVGIDLWRSIDQSGNSPEATTKNLALNGVVDRVRLDTGDMTKLPYEDGSFDVVTASVSIHNIRTVAGRRTAIVEAVRVVKPGGRLVIADIQRAREYLKTLRELGVTVDADRSAGWRIWWTGPWMPTRIIVATK